MILDLVSTNNPTYQQISELIHRNSVDRLYIFLLFLIIPKVINRCSPILASYTHFPVDNLRFFLRSRKTLKNSVNNIPHSSAKTPRIVSV